MPSLPAIDCQGKREGIYPRNLALRKERPAHRSSIRLANRSISPASGHNRTRAPQQLRPEAETGIDANVAVRGAIFLVGQTEKELNVSKYLLGYPESRHCSTLSALRVCARSRSANFRPTAIERHSNEPIILSIEMSLFR